MTFSWTRWNVALMVCVAAMFGVSAKAAAAAAGDGLKVKTADGKVMGTSVGEMRMFLGIPYAAPPVGVLRWKAPQAAAKWKGVKGAYTFGAHCMQPTLYADMIFRDAGGSEDCLTLNVWTPAKDAKAKLPVMVWIYGGGFLAGGTSERRQDGANLAKNGVIVVTMNYRLGVFGFFATKELAAESGHGSAGNYGLMDQTAALRWVKQNIKEFGGDPENVTLFGESAGSFSVNAQMASPLAKGLFQRVIGESGGALYGQAGLSFKPLAVAEERNEAFVATISAKTLEQQRAMPAQELMEAAMKKPEGGGEGFHFSADVDGYFMPESVPAIFAAGRQNDVPMMAGWNRDEGGVAPKTTVESMKADVEKQFGEHATEVERLYPVADDTGAVRAMADLMGDRFIAFSTWRWLEAQKATGKQPVWRYRFDQAPPADPNHLGGLAAYHSAEIPYVFGDLDLLEGFSWRTEDRQTSAAMQRYWTNFAKTGDPNGEGLPKWPQYGPEEWQVMHLGAESAAAPDAGRAREMYLDTVWGR